MYYHAAAIDAIKEAIETGGNAKAEDYNIDAILDECFELNPHTAEWEQTATQEEFWASVERNEVTQ